MPQVQMKKANACEWIRDYRQFPHLESHCSMQLTLAPYMYILLRSLCTRNRSTHTKEYEWAPCTQITGKTTVLFLHTRISILGTFSALH